MSLTRINHFHAAETSVDTLRTQLEAILPMIRASEGCESVQLLQSIAAPSRFVVVEVWASIEVPETNSFITPIIYAIPVQLLAYYAAIAKGTDVDQPRNLAKSVTVE